MTDTHFEKASITAKCAKRIIDAGVKKSEELGLTMTIAILDESAQLKAFYRMDGASLISIQIAQNKAYTAATFPKGRPTQEIYQRIADKPAVLGTFENLPGYSLIPGGFPIKIGDQQIGSIGVSGGLAPQDVEVAEAALAAL